MSKRRNFAFKSDLQKKNFAHNMAKTTLFQPLQLDTVKVDSFVKASEVANKISEPGKPYETTEALIRYQAKANQQIENLTSLSKK